MTWWNQLWEIFWPEWALRALGVAGVWAATWFLVRHLSRWVGRLDRRLPGVDLDERELRLVDGLLDTGIVLVALILSTYLLNLTGLLYGLLTAAGVAGVALGFAIKDVASNFVSGAFLLLGRTFVAGDVIEVAGYSGTVKKITLRTTEIVTFDGPVVTIPNSNLATNAVLNYSEADRRRVRVPLSLMVDQDLEQAVAILLDQARADQRVLKEPAPNVIVGEVRDRTVELTLFCFTAPGDWFQTASDLRKGSVEALQAAGIALAMPVLKNY